MTDSKSIYREFIDEESAAAAARPRKETPLRISDRWRKALSGDPARIGETVDLAGYTENCLGLTGWTTGFELAVANLKRNMFVPWRDMTSTVEEVVEGENTVVIRSRNEATHVGEFLGIAPTGRRVAWDAIAIIHTREARVVGMWAQADLYGIYRQLTAV
jgi:predicted ester cyclase